MTRYACVLSLVLTLVPAVASAVWSQERAGAIRVYLEPLPAPSSGFVDADTKRKADSHKDLVKRLRLKKKHIALVTDRAAADIELVLVSSKEEETPNSVSAVVPFTMVAVTRKTLPALRVQMTAPGYQRELHHQGTWGQAASRVVDEVETWARDNRELLLSKRGAR